MESVALTAGSPKLRVAFGFILKDEKMIVQKKWVEEQLRVKGLRDKEKGFIEQVL